MLSRYIVTFKTSYTAGEIKKLEFVTDCESKAMVKCMVQYPNARIINCEKVVD